MTPTETRAYEWLLASGYAADEITFQHRHSPDFLTAGGGRWEVKRLIYGAALFHLRQITELRQAPPTVVVFWKDGETEPTSLACFHDLPLPGTWNDIRIRVNWQPKFSYPIPVLSAAEVDRLAERYLAAGPRTAVYA